jgi:hypothetical protein
MNLGTALTVDDVSGFYRLSAEFLASEPLTVRIPAVT